MTNQKYSTLIISLLASLSVQGSAIESNVRETPGLEALQKDSYAVQAFLAENAGNKAKARLLYEKGCANGEGAACLGRAKIAEEKSADYRAYVERACALKDALGCFLAAWLGHRAPAEQKSLFSESCNQGLGEGCFQRAQLGGENDNAAWLEKGCKLLHWESCNQWGISMHRKGKKERARKVFSALCDQKPELGCNNLGIVERDLGQRDKARRSFEKACYQAKDYGGCNSLGALEKDGGNLAAARKLYELACKNGNQMACDNRDDLPN